MSLRRRSLTQAPSTQSRTLPSLSSLRNNLPINCPNPSDPNDPRQWRARKQPASSSNQPSPSKRVLPFQSDSNASRSRIETPQTMQRDEDYQALIRMCRAINDLQSVYNLYNWVKRHQYFYVHLIYKPDQHTDVRTHLTQAKLKFETYDQAYDLIVDLYRVLPVPRLRNDSGRVTGSPFTDTDVQNVQRSLTLSIKKFDSMVQRDDEYRTFIHLCNAVNYDVQTVYDLYNWVKRHQDFYVNLIDDPGQDASVRTHLLRAQNQFQQYEQGYGMIMDLYNVLPVQRLRDDSGPVAGSPHTDDDMQDVQHRLTMLIKKFDSMGRLNDNSSDTEGGEEDEEEEEEEDRSSKTNSTRDRQAFGNCDVDGGEGQGGSTSTEQDGSRDEVDASPTPELSYPEILQSDDDQLQSELMSGETERDVEQDPDGSQTRSPSQESYTQPPVEEQHPPVEEESSVEEESQSVGVGSGETLCDAKNSSWA